ncbi:Dienelactone hydrolase family [Pseudonocardia sp. Ae707_Ps1]|nr:Dienelactone hydrolase family [Pseudonocardia sp. Ae707_Ps1]
MKRSRSGARHRWRRGVIAPVAHSNENPAQNVTFPSAAGTAHGYLKLPESGSGPGVVVIQEWWGLTDHIVDVTDRLAAEGFVALAPDLYGGRTTHDSDEAGTLMGELPVQQAATDLGGAVQFLLDHEAVTSETVGSIGFCMGGGFVLVLAAQQPHKVSAAVPFYGVLGEDYPSFGQLTAAVQGHFGRDDQMADPASVEKLAERIERESGRKPEFHQYPAGHAFFNDENLMGTYDREQAGIAWGRAVQFLREQVK